MLGKHAHSHWTAAWTMHCTTVGLLVRSVHSLSVDLQGASGSSLVSLVVHKPAAEAQRGPNGIFEVSCALRGSRARQWKLEWIQNKPENPSEVGLTEMVATLAEKGGMGGGGGGGKGGRGTAGCIYACSQMGCNKLPCQSAAATSWSKKLGASRWTTPDIPDASISHYHNQMLTKRFTTEWYCNVRAWC